MASEADWSDEDEEIEFDSETYVQLGIPDGPITTQSDILDPGVSRIGGHPAFLASLQPLFNSSCCKNCSNPMQLLVQMWCPLEDNPHDRALYVWGCAQPECQRKEGSVRAWRGLRFNEKYAAKLEKKKARQLEIERAKKAAAEAEKLKKEAAKVNPFSRKGSVTQSSPFGLGTATFDEVAPGGQPKSTSTQDAENDESEEDADDLVAVMEASSMADSEWTSAPAYPAAYLSTISEYIPSANKPKPLPKVDDGLDDDGPKDKNQSWAEGYENSLDVDQAFERFTRRVGYQPDQCIRYELGGTPLPFAKDPVFDRIFPLPTSKAVFVTKAQFTAQSAASQRSYEPSTLPSCPHCGDQRVFESQLMPNLINILRTPTGTAGRKQTDEERRREVEELLKHGQCGMEWGTCLIFSCKKDCCLEDGKDIRSCWREELVFVQWDA